MKIAFRNAAMGALIACCAARSIAAAQTAPTMVDPALPGDVAIVDAVGVADVCFDPGDAAVVRIAAGLLADDVERVTGKRPAVRAGAPTSRVAVIVGTIGASKPIDAMIASGKLDVAGVRGKWESSLVAAVDAPMPGVDRALVIAGSDRRGTAYGVVDLCERIGVSPWYWWADVPATRRASIAVRVGTYVHPSPAVKYRGIFINDEDWGLRPWAAKTFEPDFDNIGPKTYAKVFELLLRLKANSIWPAMHPGTIEFGEVEGNLKVADEWAIVTGASHAEPMNRNNVYFDEKKLGEWRYDTNSAAIKDYWDEWAARRAKFENMWTVGLRGIHDSGMKGPRDTPGRVALVTQAIDDQRALLAKHTGRDAREVPQAFVPYKEVLTLYRAGLKVPDDVTLVWPDDNHGYIRQLSTADEQKRAGGAGVYYHISYWGRPEDYLWLDTTPIAQIWQEMGKAYDNGARTLWMLNVGDIKPGERGMDFFLRMAWDPTAWDESSQTTYLTEWATRTFGPQHAAEIAAVMDEYYRLNFAVRPEHLDAAKFYATRSPDHADRAKRFEAIVARADKIYAAIPASHRDALYQLVVYPVRGTAAMNDRWRNVDPAERMKAWERIQAETRYYNDEMAGGKWRGVMPANTRDRNVFSKPGTRPFDEPAEAPAPAVLIEAETPTRKSAVDGANWRVIGGLGVSGDSIALRPAVPLAAYTAKLDYDFTAPAAGPATIRVQCLPTHMVHFGLAVRYAASIDGGAESIVDLETAEFSEAWSANVLRATATGVTKAELTAGKHTLTLRPLDPGLVFDRISIDIGR